jgi:hypothetical protein
MNGLDLPLIPIGTEESGEYLIFLPAVRTDELEEVNFAVDEDDDVLQIACIYGEDESGQPVGNTYPIEINDLNRAHIDALEKLVVMHPSDQDIDELTDDPDTREDLEELFDFIEELEKELEEENPPA